MLKVDGSGSVFNLGLHDERYSRADVLLGERVLAGGAGRVGDLIEICGPSGAPLQLLAIYSGVRSISPLVPQVLTALGNTKLPMQSNVAGAIGFPIAFVIASRWGAAGVAAAWIIVHPFFLAPMYRTAFRAIDLPVKDYVGALWPAISGAAVMAAAVLATRHWLVAGWTALAQLLELSVVGAIAYAVTLLLVHRGRVRALKAMLGELQAGG